MIPAFGKLRMGCGFDLRAKCRKFTMATRVQKGERASFCILQKGWGLVNTGAGVQRDIWACFPSRVANMSFVEGRHNKQVVCLQIKILITNQALQRQRANHAFLLPSELGCGCMLCFVPFMVILCLGECITRLLNHLVPRPLLHITSIFLWCNVKW